MPIELDLVAGERRAGQDESVEAGGMDPLVGRVGDDDDDEALELELPGRGVREGDVADVRRVEGAPENAGGQAITMVSPPTSTSVPFRAPAARSAASSSAAGGGSPRTRKPRSVRRIRNALWRGRGR